MGILSKIDLKKLIKRSKQIGLSSTSP